MTNRTDGNECELEVAELSTSYVKLLRYARGENRSSLCSETNLANLRQMIAKNQAIGNFVFQSYQDSRMGTKKRQLFDH